MQTGHHLCSDFSQQQCLKQFLTAHLHIYSISVHLATAVSQREKWGKNRRERTWQWYQSCTDLMIHNWQRWSSALSVMADNQKQCSFLSASPSTSLSALSAALNGSVWELCRGGMQQTGLEPIGLGRFKGNFTTYWRHGHSSFEACVSII